MSMAASFTYFTKIDFSSGFCERKNTFLFATEYAVLDVFYKHCLVLDSTCTESCLAFCLQFRTLSPLTGNDYLDDCLYVHLCIPHLCTSSHCIDARLALSRMDQFCCCHQRCLLPSCELKKSESSIAFHICTAFGKRFHVGSSAIASA